MASGEEREGGHGSGVWLRVTEEDNALDYLKRCGDFLEDTHVDLWAWKWVAIALHGALYGFMICALKGTHPPRVADKRRHARDGDEYLIGFWEALKLCQSRDAMLMTTESRVLELSDEQRSSIDRLVGLLRNEFEHFYPKSLSIELHGMPHIMLDVLDVIEFLALESGNYTYLPDGKDDELRQLIQDLRGRAQAHALNEDADNPIEARPNED